MLRLFDIQESNDITSGMLFQTNLLLGANTGSPWFERSVGNPIGNPTVRTDAALDYFGVNTIRYPGGGTNASFADGMMINGRLPQHVTDILSYAQANGISVNMVVPVDTPDGLTRASFLQQLTQFAEAVQVQFPSVVRSYELGNEYWGGRQPFDESLERIYGTNAAETALALGRGMSAAGYDADVFLQASGNLRGAFGNSSDLANGAIQQGFELVRGAMDVLDGVIRNNYWRADDIAGFDNSTGLFGEDRGLEFNLGGDLHNWDTWLGRDVIRVVGEYNINRNIGIHDDGIDLGIHGASFLLEHMTNMIDAGVDRAFAWPLLHNTQNAYLFQNEAITTASVHGLQIATNTTRVAMLDLMRQTLTSHELVNADWSFGTQSNDVEVTLFRKVAAGPEEGQGEKIVFLSSRNAEPMTFTADLSAFVPDYGSVRGIAIHYEPDGSHLRDAVVREVPISDPDGDGIFTVTLRPYEVVQFLFTDVSGPAASEPPEPDSINATDTAAISGTDLADRFMGTAGADSYQGLGGNDVIFGQGGNDRVLGGLGDDTIRGQAGDDYLDGGDGSDILRGDVGNDRLLGGQGSDQLFGGHGRDTLNGGMGNDTLNGDNGNDRLFGGGGNDSISGGGGHDLLRGGHGHDRLDGGAGNDQLYGGLGRDLFIFTSGHGHDVIHDFNLRSGDRIDLSALELQIDNRSSSFFSAMSDLARQVGPDVVITTSDNSSVTLKQMDLFQLTSEHFLF